MHNLFKLKDLSGYQFKALDGEIGKLQQVYFDDRRWSIRYLVVRTGNWLLGREVLILPKVIKAINEKSQQIEVDLTQKQIKESPPVDAKRPVSRHYELQYHSYYGIDPYWQIDPFYSMAPALPPLVEQEPPKPPEHPHLRSSDEVTGYQIHANDGEIGHVEDFILDDQDWTIRYLEIDTGKFFSGKKILVSPAWIGQVDWAKEEVRVSLPCELLKTAPEYDDSKAISSDYQLALNKHYDKAVNQSPSGR